jgi:orotidine-5'-phosphate decarboxylase
MGSCGYSSLGAVVGATDPEAAKKLRQIMPNCIFLVPGYGTQGGTAEASRACFKDDGTGAIVTATRSIIYAYETEQYKDSPTWEKAVESAIVDMKQQISSVLVR